MRARLQFTIAVSGIYSTTKMPMNRVVIGMPIMLVPWDRLRRVTATVELPGAAQLHGATSSDRMERGLAKG